MSDNQSCSKCDDSGYFGGVDGYEYSCDHEQTIPEKPWENYPTILTEHEIKDLCLDFICECVGAPRIYNEGKIAMRDFLIKYLADNYPNGVIVKLEE